MLKRAKQKSNSLNLKIAKFHQLAGQIVGMQLSIANVLALVVSAASVVAGATMLAAQQFPSSWPLWLAAAGIGTGLAILIEGLTLGALIRVRVAGREIRRIEAHLGKERDSHVKGLALPDPTRSDYPVCKRRYQDVRKMIARDYQRARRYQTRQARRDRRNSLLQAIGGCIASMCGGGLFYHAILGGLGQVMSVLLSVVFTLAITGTFISSEVFKDLQEQAIREAFANGNLAEGAMRQETRMLSLWAVYDQTHQFFQSPDSLRVIAEGGKLLVTSILEDLHQDLRRSLAPEERATPVIGSPIPQALQITQDVLTPAHNLGQADATSTPDAAMQGHAVGYDRGQGTCSIDGNNQSEDVPERAMDSMAQQATLLLPDSLKNKEGSYEELDAIGRVLPSLLERIDPREREEILQLALDSPSQVVVVLQQRYPDYAYIFTAQRIAQFMQMIARRDTAKAPSNEHTGAFDPRRQNVDQHQETGYDPQESIHRGIDHSSEARQNGSLAQRESIQRPGQALKSAELGMLEEGSESQHPRKKRGNHRERIKTVMRQTQALTAFPSYRQIADASGVGYSTVKKYARAIREELQEEDG